MGVIVGVVVGLAILIALLVAAIMYNKGKKHGAQTLERVAYDNPSNYQFTNPAFVGGHGAAISNPMYDGTEAGIGGNRGQLDPTYDDIAQFQTGSHYAEPDMGADVRDGGYAEVHPDTVHPHDVMPVYDQADSEPVYLDVAPKPVHNLRVQPAKPSYDNDDVEDGMY